MKPVVIGIAFRRARGLPVGYEILTNKRMVRNKAYDPLYDNTWEAMGETMEPGENVVQTLIRGFREEYGRPDFIPLRVYGGGGHVWEKDRIGTVYTTGKGDSMMQLEPYDFVQSIGPPQPWIGPVFAVEVLTTFEPDHTASDSEAAEPRWWEPQELAAAIKLRPHEFFGLSMPSLQKLASHLSYRPFLAG